MRALAIVAILLTIGLAGCAADPPADETTSSSSSSSTASSSSSTSTSTSNTTSSSTTTTTSSNTTTTTSSNSTTTTSSGNTTGNQTGNQTGNTTGPQPTQTIAGEFVFMNPTACSGSAATGYLGLGDLDGIGLLLEDILPESVGGTMTLTYETTAPPAGLIAVFFKGSAGAGTLRVFPAADNLVLTGIVPDSDSVYIDACGGGQIAVSGVILPAA